MRAFWAQHDQLWQPNTCIATIRHTPAKQIKTSQLFPLTECSSPNYKYLKPFLSPTKFKRGSVFYVHTIMKQFQPLRKFLATRSNLKFVLIDADNMGPVSKEASINNVHTSDSAASVQKIHLPQQQILSCLNWSCCLIIRNMILKSLSCS